MFCAARDLGEGSWGHHFWRYALYDVKGQTCELLLVIAVACLPWPKLKPTELDLEIWRLMRRLIDLNREISAIEDETGIHFNPDAENYKNILGKWRFAWLSV